jgi:chromosome segregation ATPase
VDYVDMWGIQTYADAVPDRFPCIGFRQSKRQALSDYALQFGFVLVVLTVACAAVIISRRNYIKSADFKRSIEALRLEFRSSIDAAQAATTKSTRALSENVVLAIEPIDETVTDLTGRLARLEQQAEATATHTVENQKRSLEENEQIAALKQNLKALTSELSLLKQTIDEAIVRELNNSIEVINSRLITTQRQVDDLLPHLVLGEKARKDLGTLINLFVKRVKKLNANATETALRLSDLENRFSSKARHTVQFSNARTTVQEGQTDDLVEDATPKGADGPVPIETNTDSENAEAFEASATSVEESSGEARIANVG